MSRLEIDAKIWAELSTLLDEALDRPHAEREQWLEGLAPQFESLKPHLRDLLSRAAVVETRDFLDTIPPLRNANPQERAGDIVGPYRLLRELGAGGMGSVWLAERADGLIIRPIALKLPHLFTPRRAELADRLAREREILATLDHPNIARLLDAGLTNDGQPFLALEYVEGMPIDQYCEGGDGREPAALEQRLRLFLQVANAVAYAHGRLVVHRDLKPANILVTAQGEVRLLDFGIAKLLDEGQARATRLTELSGRAMTPDYASPEQILGDPLTVASDVYSLGVVLYELLSGERPYRLKRDSRGALEDAIVQVEPRSLSEVVPAPRRKALRGDIDTIVLKALKKAPHERYATVNALAEDISRYLSNRPVLARPDSRWYRVRKFVARNKLGLAASAVVLLAVLAGAGVAVWQARVAIAERDRAETVKALIGSIFEDADVNASGKVLSAADLLLRADREFRGRPIADPRVRAELTTVLARGLFSLNEDAASERLASEALTAARTALPPDDPNVLRLDVLVAEQKRYRGETTEALALVDEALGYFARAPEKFGNDYVRALIVRGDILIDTNGDETAIEAARAALAAARRISGAEHRLTLWATSALGQALDAAGQGEESLEVTREALRVGRRVAGGNERDPFVMDARIAYGKALGAVGRYDLASDELESVIRDAAAVHGERSVEVGIYLQNAAVYQLKAGRIRAGIDSATRSMDIRAGALAASSAQSMATRYVYARGLLLGRRAADALPVLSGLQEGMAAALGPLDVRTLEARSAFALALAYTGSLAEAKSIADETIAAASRKGAAATHQPWHVRALIFRLQGDARATLEHESTALRRMSDQATPAERAEVLAELGAAQALTGDAASAERNLVKSLEQLDAAGHTATPVRADAQARLARLRLSQNRAVDALPLAQQADEFWRSFDAGNRAAGEAALWLGRTRLALGQPQQASEPLQRARKLLTGSPLPSDAELLKLTGGR